MTDNTGHTPPDTSARKDAHLDLARAQMNEMPAYSLDRIALPYSALPELSIDEVDITTSFMGASLSAPIMITGMTGGTARADAINEHLVMAAETANIAIGLGSQRASLEAGTSQSNLRKLAPKACLIGNIGGAQLASTNGIELAIRAVEDIEADGLAIHLNPLQEIIQPEGDHDWRGVERAIGMLVDRLDCPVLVKEVGAGLSAEVVSRLAAQGVRHIDLACKGGTNWALIEYLRQSPENQPVYAPFIDTGYALADAIGAARESVPDAVIIASGGLRHGLDIAKSLWLGANMGGMAGAMLRQLEDDDKTLHPERLASALDMLKTQIRTALFLSGASSVTALKRIRTRLSR